MSSLRSRLDADQIIQEVYDSTTESLRTTGSPPIGGATEALQQDQLVELQAINQNTDTLETLATANNVSTASMDTKLSEIRDKLGYVLVTEPYDNIQMTYVGVTTKIDTVTYKLGVVAVVTLTLGYDGSDRLTSVTRS